MKCPLRALIKGQLSARARLAKAEKVNFGKSFTCFSPQFVYYLDLEGLSFYLSSLFRKLITNIPYVSSFCIFLPPAQYQSWPCNQNPLRPRHATPRKANCDDVY